MRYVPDSSQRKKTAFEKALDMFEYRVRCQDLYQRPYDDQQRIKAKEKVLKAYTNMRAKWLEEKHKARLMERESLDGGRS